MRVLIVNTSESTGGAAVAANRLKNALINNGVQARMLVRDKHTGDITVSDCGKGVSGKWNFLWERFVIWVCNGLRRRNLFKVSIANTGIDITCTQEFRDADIIHLHWVNQGMLSLRCIGKILRSGKPVVWTMHDMWPLTSICHHAYECDRYSTQCECCPQLCRPGRRDLSARVFKKKQKLLGDVLSVHDTGRLTFVAVSEWLADRARQSVLTAPFPVRVIPNVLPLQQFTIVDRIDARTNLGINERYVLAFGAARIDDDIKGFSYLAEALRLLTEEKGRMREDFHLLLFGHIRDPKVLDTIPVPYTHLGFVDDVYRLSLVYSAADVTVSSSLYETFGQTLIEAMACGSVPVSFDGSGQADIISHLKNGYLATRLSAKSLAEGIDWALSRTCVEAWCADTARAS
jgi:glycosyltransferase involved in cell wall biosynthesis